MEGGVGGVVVVVVEVWLGASLPVTSPFGTAAPISHGRDVTGRLVSSQQTTTTMTATRTTTSLRPLAQVISLESEKTAPPSCCHSLVYASIWAQRRILKPQFWAAFLPSRALRGAGRIPNLTSFSLDFRSSSSK